MKGWLIWRFTISFTKYLGLSIWDTTPKAENWGNETTYFKRSARHGNLLV